MILENRNNRGPGPEGSLLTHARERRAAHVGHFHRLLFWQPMKKEERIFRLEITSTTFELSPLYVLAPAQRASLPLRSGKTSGQSATHAGQF